MPDYQWDPRRRQYIKPNGKPLTPAEQRKIGLRIVSKSADALEDLTQTYVDGKITSRIGPLQCAKASRPRIAPCPSSPLAAKNRWAQGSAGSSAHCSCSNTASSAASCMGVQSGDDTPSPGRSAQYGQSGWISYTESIAQREKYAGMQEERSFLEPDADHCEECFQEAGKGWQPIGTLVPVGDRTCRANDQCEFEYRQSSTADARITPAKSTAQK